MSAQRMWILATALVAVTLVSCSDDGPGGTGGELVNGQIRQLAESQDEHEKDKIRQDLGRIYSQEGAGGTTEKALATAVEEKRLSDADAEQITREARKIKP